MRTLRAILAVLGILLLVAVGLLLAYSLPSHEVVKISGDVNRINGQIINSQKMQVNRDVFFIYAENEKTHDMRVFRNEDTHAGFPWYFKYDSFEVQARANNLANKQAVVTYYGWRVPMFNLFPNAVDVQAWESPDAPFPLFNTIFFTVLGLLILVVWWKWWRWRKRRAAAAIAAAPQVE